MRIDINTALQPQEPKYKKDYQKFSLGHTDYKEKSVGYTKYISTQSLFDVHNNISHGEIFHSNYLEYLELCWGNHYGIVVSPDIIWHILLCEIATIVAESPERYRSLFTHSAEQEEISVQSDSLTILPLDKIATQLQKKIPGKFADLFLPRFSTTTDRSEWAIQATLADISSPYYSYSMYCCGIPFVEVEGAESDWQKLLFNYAEITNTLLHIYTDNSLQMYFTNAKNVVRALAGEVYVDWKKFFSLEKCGSGSETEVFGWITSLFHKQPEGVRKVRNFSTCISNVSYTQLDTGRKFTMKNGLLYSSVENNLLRPDFGYVVYEKREEEKKEVRAEVKIYSGTGKGGIVRG